MSSPSKISHHPLSQGTTIKHTASKGSMGANTVTKGHESKATKSIVDLATAFQTECKNAHETIAALSKSIQCLNQLQNSTTNKHSINDRKNHINYEKKSIHDIKQEAVNEGFFLRSKASFHLLPAKEQKAIINEHRSFMSINERIKDVLSELLSALRILFSHIPAHDKKILNILYQCLKDELANPSIKTINLLLNDINTVKEFEFKDAKVVSAYLRSMEHSLNATKETITQNEAAKNECNRALEEYIKAHDENALTKVETRVETFIKKNYALSNEYRKNLEHLLGEIRKAKKEKSTKAEPQHENEKTRSVDSQQLQTPQATPKKKKSSDQRAQEEAQSITQNMSPKRNRA